MNTDHSVPAIVPAFTTATSGSPRERTWWTAGRERPELLVFAAVLVVFNAPLLAGSFWHSLIFQPQAVQDGEWWRVLTHPFVHATWYHLLLDGSAFLLLYLSLAERRLTGRLAYVAAGGVGSLLCSWWFAPAISSGGFCGLSGIAHGLMAVSAIEMIALPTSDPVQRRLGWISFILVVGKAALEALSGRMFFTFLHFGLMGDPVAVSHAGGLLGSLSMLLLLGRAHPGPDVAATAGETRLVKPRCRACISRDPDGRLDRGTVRRDAAARQAPVGTAAITSSPVDRPEEVWLAPCWSKSCRIWARWV